MAYSTQATTNLEWWEDETEFVPDANDHDEIHEAYLSAEIARAKHETKLRLWEELSGYVEMCQQTWEG